MWHQKTHVVKKSGGNGLVAVAVDKDKGSQHALRWAVENLLTKGHTVILIHVLHKSSNSGHSQVSDGNGTLLHTQQVEKINKDLFLTFRCYCTRKDVQCLDVLLEDTDIAKAITEYVAHSAIENLVFGAPSRHGFIRRFKTDVPSSASKAAPDFCTVYVISKGKISSVRNASRSAPFTSPLLGQLQRQNSHVSTHSRNSMSLREHPSFKPHTPFEDIVKGNRSPFPRRGFPGKSYADFSDSDTDISFVSSGRPSTDCNSTVFLDLTNSAPNSRISNASDQSIGSMRLGIRFSDKNSLHDFSTISEDSGRTSCSCSSQNVDEVEAEMRRLKLELKQTMDMYSTACKEALTAKQKAMELQRWRIEEEQRLEETQYAEEAALSAAEKEKTKSRAVSEAAKRIAELEAHKRVNLEARVPVEKHDLRYRRYSIEEIEKATDHFSQSRKIGEGGYGPVYKCYLDHTAVAVKVLRPDAAQGRSQFQQEIEVLCCIRHPNMVLLVGACPEYGIIVYEYMAKGSLDDCLQRRGNTPPLPWQLRFRIAAEIATGLLFLHQSKPEPIVHRDLKPGNILLDHNYVSKISDVGLARLVPAIAENVTQYRMTSTAGTFCYIDPEYQQTGMLGVKSDVYSLGVMLLQVITAKPPMGLAHHIEAAIEAGTFPEMLDPSVPDWPMEETLVFAKLAVQCAQLRRKDRPDLGTVVMPELNRLREFAEENMSHFFLGGGVGSLHHNKVPATQEVMSDPQLVHSGLSSKSSTSSQM